MSIRVARILIVGAAGLMGLSACSTAPKLNDETSSTTPKDGGVTGIFSDLWPSKKDKQPRSTAATRPAPCRRSRPNRDRVASRWRRCRIPACSATIPMTTCSSARNISAATISVSPRRASAAPLEKHPNDAEAWVGLAASYDRLHRFDLADRAYAEAIRIIGPTAEILNDQGFSYMLRGDYARAHKKLQEAQAKDPSNPYVQANLQLLEESYRNGKAIQ